MQQNSRLDFDGESEFDGFLDLAHIHLNEISNKKRVQLAEIRLDYYNMSTYESYTTADQAICIETPGEGILYLHLTPEKMTELGIMIFQRYLNTDSYLNKEDVINQCINVLKECCGSDAHSQVEMIKRFTGK